jgi:ABC-2 type transport system permease protein
VSQFAAIARAKLLIAKHSIGAVRSESKLKVSFVSIFALALWIGALIFFKESFEFLLRFGAGATGEGRGIGAIVLPRMLGVLTLVVFFMLIFSNILVSFSTLYRSREVTYLLHAPLTFRTLFLARFAECVIFSSWALAFLGAPLIIAYGYTTSASPAFYFASVLFFLPFIAIPAALGAGITLILVRIFPSLRMTTIIAIGVAAVAFLYYYMDKRFGVSTVSDDTILPTLMDMTSQPQSPFLPSYWAVRGVLAAAEGNYREASFNLLLLLANALMLLWLTAEIAQRIYHSGWSALVGRGASNSKWARVGILAKIDAISRPLPSPYRVLVSKDIRLFWRDATQWSQFVIFFGIMAVYIANLRNMSGQYQREFWKGWIACLNTGACTLILATLTSRFVFPLISLEGRRFWILGLAPLTFRQLVRQKFWLSVLTTSFFTIGLAVLSGVMLKLEPLYFALSVYSVIITNFGLSGLAVGLGALYPNFQEDNPARVVSGMGGTLNFLLSVGYIACIISVQTLILQWRAFGLYTSEAAFNATLAAAIILITTLSAVATLLPLKLGLKNLNNLEF